MSDVVNSVDFEEPFECAHCCEIVDNLELKPSGVECDNCGGATCVNCPDETCPDILNEITDEDDDVFDETR